MWLVLACAHDPGGKVPDDSESTPTEVHTGATDPEHETGTPPGGHSAAPPGPTTLSVTCSPTDNVLRFTCDVAVDPPQPVELRWRRADGLGPERSHGSDDRIGAHAVPLYFVAPDTEYVVEAVAPEGDAVPATTSVTGGVPPTEVGAWLTSTGTSTLGLIGTEAPCTTRAVAEIFDTETGALVWYQDLDPQGELGMLYMVRYLDDQTVLGITNGRVVQVDLQGRDVVRFDTDYEGCCDLNHDVHRKDDTIVGQYQQELGGGLILDAAVFFDPQGNEQFQLRPQDYLNVPGSARGDYLHNNSDFLDADGNLLQSWLNQDTVAKIDADPASPTFGRAIWLMSGDGRPHELGNDITIDWSAVPDEDSFGGQHCFHQRRDGRYMLLDNDHGRGLVLSIDDAARTATVDAAYDTRERSCGAQGTAMDTRSGNAVVACLSRFVREYDAASGAMVWEAEAHCRNSGGGGWSPNAGTRWYPLDGWQ